MKIHQNRRDHNYDRLWKLISFLKYFGDKLCNPTENFAMYDVILLYKGRIVLHQYIPKKHKQLEIKLLYNLCSSPHNMLVYLGKQRLSATPEVYPYFKSYHMKTS